MEGLVLWVIILLLLVSSFFGKIGNKIAGKKGKYIGYAIPSLVFIGIVVYNVAEYYYIKNQVKNLCEKEAGIFIYVTPEQWIEQNKDELNELYQFGTVTWDDKELRNEVEKQEEEIKRQYPTFVYEGIEYKNLFIYNERIVQYRKREKINYYVANRTDLLVDIKTGQLLAKAFYNSAGVSGFMSINHWADLKYWMDDLPHCRHIEDKFMDLSRQFSNPSLQKGSEQ